MSKIEAQNPQDNVQEGQRLMIIELERYNEIRELLIEDRTTGSHGHLCYWDRGQRVSVTRDADRGQKHIQLASELGMRIGMHRTTVEQSKKD